MTQKNVPGAQPDSTQASTVRPALDPEPEHEGTTLERRAAAPDDSASDTDEERGQS